MVTASTPAASSAVDIREALAAERAGHEVALFRFGIGDADQRHPRKVGKHARVVAAHHADADDTDAKRLFRGDFGLFFHAPTIPHFVPQRCPDTMPVHAERPQAASSPHTIGVRP